ncbi:MAG: adenylate cyclase [Parasphingorhabdus sp.]|jgi:adenylate cyclase
MTVARILVVDDEPDVEALVTQKFRRQIRKEELEFVFARDGIQALDVLRDEPDILMVLSDINMPRMDGLALLEQLNELHQDLKTVIVSAYGDMANIRTAMNRGAFDFITKPIEFDDLEKTIEKTIKHLQVFRQLKQEKRVAEQAHSTLSRYFSPDVAKALSDNPAELSAKGDRRVASFLFTDLADFTALVESTNSDVIVALLNEYFDHLAQIIFQHDGTVMKVVGDAIHAIFGAPLQQDDHAQRSVECALAIDKFAMQFQAEMRARDIPLGITRIGINSGQAIIGSFGGDYFFDYTAYGDAVNIAARLESANKQLGTRICVSQNVVDDIPDFTGRPAATLLLKGKSQMLKTYEPMTQERYETAATSGYLLAFDLLEKGDPAARPAFATLIGQYDDDPLTTFHLGRLLAGNNSVEIELATK